MGTWQLEEAQAKLGDIIDSVVRDGPQVIVRRGVETAVIVPIDEWRRDHPRQVDTRTLLELFQSGPDIELPIPPRGSHKHRKPPVF